MRPRVVERTASGGSRRKAFAAVLEHGLIPNGTPVWIFTRVVAPPKKCRFGRFVLTPVPNRLIQSES